MAPSSKHDTQLKSYLPSSLTRHTYDVICIGSGWAARSVASRAVQAGLTAIMIEHELIGGDCPFWACVPSKALLRPSEALEGAKQVAGAREQVKASNIDVESTFARRTAFTRNWDDEELLVPAILETGTDIVRGTGNLIGEKRVAVTPMQGETVELTATHAVAICTGSIPVIPDIPGLKDAKPWMPRDATSSSKVPEHLVILGLGAVGCEMATAFASLGAEVTVVGSSAEVLPSVDPEAGELVRKSLVSRGVRVLTSTTLARVSSRKEAGRVDLILSDGRSISASEILVATGRRPRTDGCGLETFGLLVDGTPLQVDESLCVKAVPGSWLYAIGDVNARSPLTHMCKYQGRVAGNAIIQRARGDISPSDVLWSSTSATADHRAVPQVIFTQPTVASVGLTRTKAEKSDVDVRIVTSPAACVGGWLHADIFMSEPGWAQWVIDKQSNKLLGMTVVGQDVQELLHAATVAIVGEVPLDRLAHAAPSFPTMSEVYLNLAEAAGL